MIEENNFLNILEQYFLNNLDEKDILIKDNGKICFDMSWLVTEVFDRNVFKNAISNIMSKFNQNYENRSKYFNNDPSDISSIIIYKNNEHAMLQFRGADGWTKLNVTNEPIEQQNGQVPTISTEELESEIAKVLSVKNITQSFKIAEKMIFSAFSRAKVEQPKAMIIGVRRGLNELAENLVWYYKYLIENKKIHSKHICTIQQEKSEGVSKTIIGEGTKPRFNTIIPFKERADILQNRNNLLTTINVNEKDENGNISQNSYIVYVYTDLLNDISQKQDGYLFICEPVSGDRSTRFMYFSREEFDQMKQQTKVDIFEDITQRYLSMSNKEFEMQIGTITSKHTDLDTFKDKINLYIDGKKGFKTHDSRFNLMQINELYGRKNKTPIEFPYSRVRISSEELKKIILGAKEINDTATKGIPRNQIEKGEN